jgi:hypothetical protein
VKMHTLLDLHGNIPTFIRITDGKVHDVNILDEFLPEAGAFYVLVAIARKRLGLEVSLYQILQILSVTIFEKVPILQAFEALDSQSEFFDSSNQMILFDF